MEETVYHVVMSGIIDKDLKEKVLTRAMLTNVRDLSSLLNYVTAEGSARPVSPQASMGPLTLVG